VTAKPETSETGGAVWIAWNTATLWALALLAFVFLARRSTRRWVVAASTGARELAVVLGLYAVWRFVYRLTVRQVNGAEEHGRWVWHLQRWMHLPSEVSLQHLMLPHGWLVQFFNGYYALAHGPALIIGLVWLFVRHRDRYPAIRNSVAIVTGLCLVIRLFPVAPPRLLPDLGFVDTALLYDQSVYGAGTGGMSNQLAAMPSIHVAWALIVALAAITASTSRWRWVALAHLVLTVLAVTVTANHWWLDGIVVVPLLWGAMAVQRYSKRTTDGAVVRPSSGKVAAATLSE
jgi:hypothetical protein